MSPSLIALLTLVALVAGIVDAIAGGGGMLTVPALLAAGLPTKIALGTNKGVSTWGTAAATLTFLRAGRLDSRRATLGFAGGAVGASLGAQLQLAFSSEALKPIVLVLLVIVAVVLAVHRPRPRPTAMEGAERAKDLRVAAIAFAIALIIGAYDGFFGPGTGTFVIVAHVSILSATLGEATADAKAVNLGSNVASLITFAIRGTVMWRVALPMAAGNVIGGIIGARLAVKGGDRIIRLMVIAVSLALVAKLANDVIR